MTENKTVKNIDWASIIAECVKALSSAAHNENVAEKLRSDKAESVLLGHDESPPDAKRCILDVLDETMAISREAPTRAIAAMAKSSNVDLNLKAVSYWWYNSTDEWKAFQQGYPLLAKLCGIIWNFEMEAILFRRAILAAMDKDRKTKREGD